MSSVILQQIIDELRATHGCHTFILYGSRARGDFTPSSDYDILGIRRTGVSTRDTRLIEGYYLDAFIYSEDQARKVDESFLRLRGGLVLEEKDDQGSCGPDADCSGKKSDRPHSNRSAWSGWTLKKHL